MRFNGNRPYLLAGTLVLALPIAASPAFSAEVAGKVVGVSGKVLIRETEGGKSKVRNLKIGDEVRKGSVINTSSSSTVKLLMTDRTILDLGASTLFKVDEYQLKGGSDRQVQMSMDYGKVRASVNRPVSPIGKFNIKTKAATMGVRGTEFIVQSSMDQATSGTAAPSEGASAQSASQTQVTVIHGKVEVATPVAKGPEGATKAHTPVFLTGGGQLTTSVSTMESGAVKVEAPKVVQLTPEQTQSVKQEAKPQDMTFIQAVAIDPSQSSGRSEEGSNRAPASSGGAATLAAVTQAIVAESPPQIQAGPPPGVPGTFGADFGVRGPLNPPPSAFVTLKVTFKR